MAEDRHENILVLDVGGHHIAAAAFCQADGTLGAVGHVVVPETGSASDFLDILEALCREVLPPSGAVAGLSMAMPSPFDYDRGISHMRHKFQQLYGVDLQAALSRRLAIDPGNIHFLNDAAAYLMGELHHGAAAGVSRAVVITLGTGIGSAFAVNGRIVTEGTGVPPGGEIWNLPYRGATVEEFAGTAAIQLLHRERTGVSAQVREIAAAAANDPEARRTFEEFGTDLGQLLRFTMSTFNPQRIVIGGGIARSSDLFFPAAQRELHGLDIEIRAALLGDRAPLLGAAMSWIARPASGSAFSEAARGHAIELK